MGIMPWVRVPISRKPVWKMSKVFPLQPPGHSSTIYTHTHTNQHTFFFSVVDGEVGKYHGCYLGAGCVGDGDASTALHGRSVQVEAKGCAVDVGR